jgi:hypothetical protein
MKLVSNFNLFQLLCATLEIIYFQLVEGGQYLVEGEERKLFMLCVL